MELAHNRAQTSLAWYNGTHMSDWSDGQEYPDDMNAPDGGCVPDGALHTSNQSYQSDLFKVTMENLAVFSVLEQYA